VAGHTSEGGSAPKSRDRGSLRRRAMGLKSFWAKKRCSKRLLTRGFRYFECLCYAPNRTAVKSTILSLLGYATEARVVPEGCLCFYRDA